MENDKIEVLRIVTRATSSSSMGFVQPSQYLRFLEHIRWSTIATSEKYRSDATGSSASFARRSFEIYDRIANDVELELTMWLSRLGNTSVAFSHDVKDVIRGSRRRPKQRDHRVARRNRQPAKIGEGAREFLIERETIRTERLTEAPPDDAWQRDVPLRPSDHDMQQHVNHARYADFVEDTRILATAAGAYGKGNWDASVRRLAITYEQEMRVGDDIVCKTWPTPGRERSLEFVLMKGAVIATRARVGFAG